MFAASVHAGWLVGIVFEIADAILALWYAFLPGTKGSTTEDDLNDFEVGDINVSAD